MTTIDVIIYSFKNKNLPKVVDAVLAGARNDVKVHVYDQHPLLREHLFTDDRVSYSHIFWDYLYAPGTFKVKGINKTLSEYVVIMSDDILLSDNWDDQCLSQLKENAKAVISGIGIANVSKKDLFSVSVDYSFSDSFTETLLVSKNFLFAARSTIGEISYPSDVKYFGEDELLSFRFFHKGIKVFSAPSYLAEDLKERTLETKYHTFSLEHKYNKIFTEISDDFWSALGFDGCPIVPLPYNPEDVSYNPNQIDFNDLDSRKFISNIKAIY